MREVVVAATSDLHGWITNDTLYPDGRPGGLAHLAPVVAELRGEAPRLILVDGGDTIQGAPNISYLAGHAPDALPLIVRLMNRLGYDAAVAGNHDLEQGAAALGQAVAGSNFPWLAANLEHPGGGLVLPPYHVIEREGVRVAVLGLTTPGVAAWVDASVLAGLRVTAIGPSARRWVAVLREMEQADLVVAVVHSGLNGDYGRRVGVANGLPLPNAAGLLGDEVEGLDLVVSGHAHRAFPREPRTGTGSYHVPVLQPGARGEAIGVARFTLVGRGGRWRVAAVRREVLPAMVRPDPEVMAELAPALEATRAWLHEPSAVRFIATLEEADFHGCAGALSHAAANRFGFAALRREDGDNNTAHQPQLTEAFSLLPMLWWFHPPRPHERGTPLRRAHLYRWMRYDNRLVLGEITARQAALLLGEYGLWRRERRVSYARVLFPGGLVAEQTLGGSEVTGLAPAGGEVPLPPHATVPVWVTAYHWAGAGGLARRALLQPSQRRGVTSLGLREMVFRLLADPTLDLPHPCSAFLEKR